MLFRLESLARWHLKSFLIIYAFFTGLIAWISNQGIDRGEEHVRLVWLTTAASISGPMIGAVSRSFQGCCLRFSLSVMKIALPILLAGIILQFIRTPDKAWMVFTKRLAWIAAWILWFLLGIATFGHALN